MVCKRRCSLKFPTIRTSAGASFAPSGFQPASAAFAEHVAQKHYLEIAELQQGLEYAFFHGVSLESPPRDRRRVVLALELIAAHLAKQGIAPFLVAELFWFRSALEDLDKGTVHYSLAHKPAGNRPVLGGDIWEVRAYVAIAIDLLCGGGDSKSVAAKKVFMGLGPLAAVIAPGAAADGRAASDWHRKFAAQQCKDRRAQAIFDTREGFLQFLSRATDGLRGEKLAFEVIRHATLLAIRAAPPEIARKTLRQSGGKRHDD